MTETILVIEDERLTRTNLLNFLNAEGFLPLGAENGRVGVQLAQTHLPDLIICDIMMPDLDGYDVLTTLQQDPSTAGIPFIFLTISENELGLEQSLALGADDYLKKPITSEQLRTAIATQLSKAPGKSQPNLMEMPIKAEPTPEVPTPDTFIQSKEALLEQLCQSLLKGLSSLRFSVEQLQATTVTPEQSKMARTLQEDFTRLLALVNEASALQKMMTPDNAEALMVQFSKTIKTFHRN